MPALPQAYTKYTYESQTNLAAERAAEGVGCVLLLRVPLHVARVGVSRDDIEAAVAGICICQRHLLVIVCCVCALSELCWCVLATRCVIHFLACFKPPAFGGCIGWLLVLSSITPCTSQDTPRNSWPLTHAVVYIAEPSARKVAAASSGCLSRWGLNPAWPRLGSTYLGGGRASGSGCVPGASVCHCRLSWPAACLCVYCYCLGSWSQSQLHLNNYRQGTV